MIFKKVIVIRQLALSQCILVFERASLRLIPRRVHQACPLMLLRVEKTNYYGYPTGSGAVGRQVNHNRYILITITEQSRVTAYKREFLLVKHKNVSHSFKWDEYVFVVSVKIHGDHQNNMEWAFAHGSRYSNYKPCS